MPKPIEHDAPADLASYLAWLAETHEVDVGNALKTRYNTIVTKLKADFTDSSFWQQIVNNINDSDSEYQIQAGYPLFTTTVPPDIYAKSFDSFLLKTFRRNVLENERWPEEPETGWFLPNSCYARFNDLVRTSFVVKYLDGVAFLGERLTDICGVNQLKCDLSFEARMEGHYAAHLCTYHDFEIPGPQWDTEKMTFPVEIQITTQLQEVIRKLLHRHYEARRALPEQERSDWQWAYQSDEFTANYLGHILHYVEGMIMEVRNRQGTTGAV